MMGSPTPLDLLRLVLGRLVSSFYLIALGMIATVVAIPIFLLTALVLVGLTRALGAEGTLAAALGDGDPVRRRGRSPDRP